jgi:hypothetical protein
MAAGRARPTDSIIPTLGFQRIASIADSRRPVGYLPQDFHIRLLFKLLSKV